MYRIAFSPRSFSACLSTVALACGLHAQAVPDSATFTPRLDEAAVLRIAGLRMTDRMNELGYPQARLCADGVWWASQVRVGHTNRGSCRKVNGCTVTHHRTVLVDDRTGRVIDRCMTKHIMPNHE
jgi:hypothetical protein